jgi:uncharacterized protein YjbI with pentapeptide repeats
MSANPIRRRPAAAKEPVQRSDGGEARLWHLGTALAVSFTAAVVGLAGLAWLAWVLLGLAGYRQHGAPALKDTVGVLQLVFATVAGAGALVALIVAYRRQKITEADSVHDRTRVFNERFTAIAAQLGDAQPAVRLAGVHAMAGLADDWKQNRQTCVDVLCAYLRLPHDPDPGEDADPAERTAYRANREVRHTVIRVIGAHLRYEAAVGWHGLNFDFTGVVFDGGDFSRAKFSGGIVLFTDAVFSGGWVRFDDAVFSGGTVDFRDAEFSGGTVAFRDAKFSGGTVDFRDAKFYPTEFPGRRVDYRAANMSGLKVDFREAKFSSSQVDFGGAEFSGGTVSFLDAEFTGGRVGFGRAEFSSGYVDFGGAKFSDGEVAFRGAEFSGGTVYFSGAEFSGGQVDFSGAEFSGGQVDFSRARPWSHPPMFSWHGKPPTGVVLPVQPSEGTQG